jgi:hypothetical protein
MSAGFRLELECGHTVKKTCRHQHFKCPQCGVQKRVVKIYKHGIEIPHAVLKLRYERLAASAAWRDRPAKLASENQALAAFIDFVDDRRDIPNTGHQ